MPRALRVCPVPGCPQLTAGGRCGTHRREADQARGSRHERGYTPQHDNFRKAVLRRDPICVQCKAAPSKHADHYPLSLRELRARGLNPYDPTRGRGLCHPCHSSQTAQHQPGGWNAR
ncbi:holin [Micromonospora aurantiaca]|uniref:Holin n=1 Tax=Micromonospora aurantiaca (nom. illeg.) TaxID=47850 RepID=A0A6N3JY72_9ACTN|nr:holin [Micromonospora aurantiaca]